MEPFKKTTISPGNLDLILSNHNAIKLIIAYSDETEPPIPLKLSHPL